MIKRNNVSLKSYISSNSYEVFIIIFFALLSYGIKLFNVTISHDTEAILSVPDSLYGSWIGMGRYGAVILKKIIGTYLFNPYIAEFMALTCFVFGAVFWSYLFYRAGMKNQKFLWIFGSVFITSIITAEQTAFLLQSYEVSLSYLFISVSIFLIFFLGSKEKWYFIVFGILLLAFSFSIYQSNVALYIAAVIMLFIVVYDNSDDSNLKDHLFLIVEFIAVLAVSLIIYFIGKKLFFIAGYSSNSYVDNQVMWKTASFSTCIKAILTHIKDVYTGKGIFYNYLLLITSLLSLIYLVVRKKTKYYWIYLVSLLTLLISPFLMTFVLGNAPSARVEVNIPFVSAFLTMYIVDAVSHTSKKMFKVAIIFVFIACMLQGQATSRLYYTEYVKGREEERLATKISDRIDLLDPNGELPVVFIGSTNLNRNKACYDKSQFELTGYSFFEISFSTQHGTFVMNHYFDTLGIKYVMPSQEQIVLAESKARDMKPWPDVDSIQKIDDIIIVKLG